MTSGSSCASTRRAAAASTACGSSIFVDDVDAVYARCRREGLEVTREPVDEVWGVREFHVRHPDGHIFRIGTGNEEDEEAARA